MYTFIKYKTTASLLILLFTFSFAGCAHNSAGNVKSKSPLFQSTRVSEIMLGPGDVLELSVWQSKEFSGSYIVDTDGNIFIPLVGEIKASGQSAYKLRGDLVTSLKKYLIDPQVQLAVTSYRSRKVYVLGEVKTPGIYQMDDTLTTIVAALSAAGGFTDGASTNSVVHIKEGFDKGDAEVLRIGSYLNNNHHHDGHMQNAPLSGGDVIYVPSDFMANVDGFFDHIAKIVSPIVEIERGIVIEPFVKEILEGKSINNNVLVVP